MKLRHFFGRREGNVGEDGREIVSFEVESTHPLATAPKNPLSLSCAGNDENCSSDSLYNNPDHSNPRMALTPSRLSRLLQDPDDTQNEPSMELHEVSNFTVGLGGEDTERGDSFVHTYTHTDTNIFGNANSDGSCIRIQYIQADFVRSEGWRRHHTIVFKKILNSERGEVIPLSPVTNICSVCQRLWIFQIQRVRGTRN